MRILIVYSHPAAESFQRTLLDALTARLSAEDHALTVLDLYAEGFDPVLDADAWRAHRADRSWEAAALAPHIAALRAAEAVIFVYPTWWFGLPAMLKGWLDRVWQPGVAFTMKDGVFQIHTLGKVTRFAVVTTYGSPRFVIEWLVGDPARRQMMRGLRLQFAKACKACWAPIYAVDGRSREDLTAARERAVDKLARFLR